MRTVVNDGNSSPSHLLINPSTNNVSQANSNASNKLNLKSQQTQTLSVVRMQSHASTQTTECQVLNQGEIAFNCNVTAKNPVLPLIQLNLNNIITNSLLDSGSSISLIDHDFFNQNKANLTYRNISRSVVISTLNSKIHFYACIVLTFKIKGIFFKNPFFVTDIQDKNFKLLLGYDFLNVNRAVIDTHNMIVKLDKVSTPICYDSQNLNDCDTSVKDINFCMSNQTENIVKLARKVQLDAGESAYALLSANVNDDCKDNFVCFNPEIKIKNLSVMPSIHQCSNSNNQFNFYVCLTNESKEILHVNKHSVMGTLSPVTLAQPEGTVDPDCVNETVNYIQPTSDMLNARKSEFDLNNFNFKHLSADEKDSISNLLKHNYAAFSSSLNTLGHTDRIVPKLNFTHDYPIKTLPFPVPQAIQSQAKSMLDELISANILERCVSEWACPMLLVKKKPDAKGHVSYRLALDLRLINQIIQHSSYPLPKIQDIISNMAQFNFFSTLDLKNAYHQIDLPREYQDKLTVTTMWGSFRYKRLVFGLKTAASTFQALIDTVVEESRLVGVFAYQDDIVICSNSFEETCTKIETLLKTFIKYNLTVCPQKCSFHTTEIDYLGFNIKSNTISPVASNIQKITAFQPPKTKRHLKRFLGLCSYYRHLVPSYAQVINPLVQMTSPSVPLRWDSEQLDAFHQLQAIFFKAPFVRQPDWNSTFYLNTDASKQAISAVLLQKFGDNLHPVSYFSKTLNKAESNYPAIKLELMAIVKSVEAFKNYLYNRQFYILSDSKPLQHYKKTVSPANIITRWLLQLSEFSFLFKHIPGKYNLLPDYFSRDPTVVSQTLNTDPTLLDSHEILPIVESNEVGEVNNLNSVDVSYNNCVEDIQMLGNTQNVCTIVPPGHKSGDAIELKGTTHIGLPSFKCNNINFRSTACDESSNILHKVLYMASTKETIGLSEIIPSELLRAQLQDSALCTLYNQVAQFPDKFKPTYFIDNNSMILMTTKGCHNDKNSGRFDHRMCLPQSLVQKAIGIAHTTHLGIAKTFELVSARYYIKGLFKIVETFVKGCNTCNKVKNLNIPKAPLQSKEIPRRVLDLVSMDILGPFQNNIYVLNIVDVFSRHLQLYPLERIRANDVVEALFHYINIFGRPHHILTDNGTQFTSAVFTQFLEKFGIHLSHSSVNHPEANAVSERVNRSIKNTIYCLQRQGVSLRHALALHCAVYNSTVHPATKASPNFIHFGRALPLITDTFDATLDTPIVDISNLILKISNTTNEVIKSTYNNLVMAQRNQNNKVNHNRRVRTFLVGDTVYLKQPNKFKKTYSGPFIVKTVLSPVMVSIQELENPNAPVLKRHINLLHWAPPRNNNNIDINFHDPNLVNRLPATTTLDLGQQQHPGDDVLPDDPPVALHSPVQPDPNDVQLQQPTTEADTLDQPTTAPEQQDDVRHELNGPRHQYNLRSRK